MTDDAALLHAYATDGSEEAFSELVRRHLGLVYHAALRQTGGDRHRAEDVTQQVFTDLARKAAMLAKRPLLVAWLYTSARYAAVQAVRAECRRQARERKAVVLDGPEFHAESEVDWDQVRPLIDDALQTLGERDRAAVLLRFFQGCSFAEVGEKLAVTEDAARVRVNRALDKVRSSLARRGLASTSSALAVALAGQAGASVPAGLAAQVSAASLAAAATATTVALGSAAGVGVGVVSFVSTAKITGGIAAALALLSLGVAVHRSGEPQRVASAPVVHEQHSTSGATRLETPEPAKLLEEEKSYLDILKNMDDPKFYEALRKEGAQMIGRTHADVFTLLALGDEQTARLKELLADRFLETFESLALARQAEANGVTFLGALDNSVEDSELRIQKLLGEDRYERFQSLEETIPFRNQLHEVRDRLAGTPHALSPEQIESYCRVMLEEWENYPEAAQALLQIEALLPFRPAPVDDTALRVAKEILDPEQYAVFSAQKAKRGGAGGKARPTLPESF